MKSKLFVFGLSLVLFISNLVSQPTIKWEKSIGGSNTDAGYQIYLDDNGGYIIGGISMSDDHDVSVNYGYYDYWIAKLDDSKNIQWEKSLGGSSPDGFKSLDQTNDGGYILAGTTMSDDGDISFNHGQDDVWIVKLSPSGDIQWEKSYGGSQGDFGASIQQTTDGGYIIGGTTISTDGDVSTNHGSYDCWLFKIDSQGNLEWEQTYGGSGIEGIHQIQQTTDGGYIFTGNTASNDGDVSNNYGDKDFWVVKTNSSGGIQWEKNYGGSNTDKARSIQQTNDGGYIVAGVSLSINGDASGNHGEEDYLVIKLNNTGQVIWSNCYGGSNIDLAWSIIQTNDNGFYVSGGSMSNNGDVSMNQGYDDFWVLKLNNSGSILWEKSLGGTDSDYAQAIQETSSGGFIVTGGSSSNDGDVSGGYGYQDIWIVETCFPDPISINVTNPNNYCYVTLNATSGFSNYEWSNGETTQSINAFVGGTYSVTAINNNDCPSNAEITISNPAPIPIYIEISDMDYCDNTELTAIGNFNNYLWNTGETTETISISQGGNYSVTGFADFDCESVASINAPNPVEPYQYSEICMITTDIQSNKNVIVYEPDNNVGIDSILIFSLNNSTSEFEQITSLSINNAGIYIDEISNPEQQYHQYKLAIKDTCGNSSELSSLHQTILLQANIGINDEVNLFWNPYIGFDYPNFGIYRKIENGDYYLIANVPNNTYTYTDNTSSSGHKNYQIRVERDYSCYPNKDYTFASSNIVDVAITGVLENSLDKAKVYPNPCTNYFNISNNNFILTDIEIMNSYGYIVYKKDIGSQDHEIRINTSELQQGLYIIKLNNSIYLKLIKE